MKRPVSCTAVLTIALLAACGGNVVVDGTPGAGGAGGSTSSSSGTTATVAPGGTGGSTDCFNPPSQAELTACGTTSGGAGSGCEFDFCDAHANVWAAKCNGAACACTLNNSVLCSCALDVAGDICAGAANCCFPTH